MKKFIKKNIKTILGFVLGLIWSSGIVYAATILFDSDEVSYDNTTSGLSATNVQSALDELYVESTSYQLFESRVSTLESQIYPVGSIYLSMTITSASDVGTLLGGTWEAISQGRVLIGAGTNGTYTFEAGSTGGTTDAGNRNTATPTITNPLGEYTHKLVTAEMPSHSHSKGVTANYSYGSGGDRFIVTNNGAGWSINTGNTSTSGSNYYHNNIQPYLVVYMYKRTA